MSVSGNGPFVDIGPEAFTDGRVISYKGANFYKACDEFVCDTFDGGQSFCVKRVDHPGRTHEAYNGAIRFDDKVYNAAEELAQAIRLTVEYVGNDVLPAKKGWSWFDALSKYKYEMANRFVERPLHFPRPSVNVVDTPILFQGRESDPKTLSEVIGQAVGAGSVCWEDMSGTGVFQDGRASMIVDEVLSWIGDRYIQAYVIGEHDGAAIR